MKTQDLFGRREECEVPQSRTQPRTGQGVKTDKKGRICPDRTWKSVHARSKAVQEQAWHSQQQGWERKKRSRAAGSAAGSAVDSALLPEGTEEGAKAWLRWPPGLPEPGPDREGCSRNSSFWLKGGLECQAAEEGVGQVAKPPPWLSSLWCCCGQRGAGDLRGARATAVSRALQSFRKPDPLPRRVGRENFSE